MTEDERIRYTAKLIARRANPTQPNMGLTTWRGACVGKNYLAKKGRKTGGGNA